MTTMRLDDLGQSTTLESNKSLIRFDLQASDHDIAVTSDRLDMEMIRQGLEALDQKVQQPLEAHADTRHIPRKEIRSTSKRSMSVRVSSETRYCSQQSTHCRPQSWH